MLAIQLLAAAALGALIGLFVPHFFTPDTRRRGLEGALICAALTALFVIGAGPSPLADGAVPVLIGAAALLLYCLFLILLGRALERRL